MIPPDVAAILTEAGRLTAGYSPAELADFYGRLAALCEEIAGHQGLTARAAREPWPEPEGCRLAHLEAENARLRAALAAVRDLPIPRVAASPSWDAFADRVGGYVDDVRLLAVRALAGEG